MVPLLVVELLVEGLDEGGGLEIDKGVANIAFILLNLEILWSRLGGRRSHRSFYDCSRFRLIWVFGSICWGCCGSWWLSGRLWRWCRWWISWSCSWARTFALACPFPPAFTTGRRTAGPARGTSGTKSIISGNCRSAGRGCLVFIVAAIRKSTGPSLGSAGSQLDSSKTAIKSLIDCCLPYPPSAGREDYFAKNSQNDWYLFQSSPDYNFKSPKYRSPI